MKFSEIVEQASDLLQRKGRVSYRAFRIEFELDDELLDALKEELLFAHPQIEEIDDRGLIWTGGGADNPEALRPPSDAPVTPPSEAAHSPEAERRQLTVMFCDIVGSTDLSEKLDAEDLREIVQAYQQVSLDVIERFDGHIAQYLGDGLLVYFGYPKAHEDDAERAVRAGLGIVEALHDLNARLPCSIQNRIGLHTGQVVVGDMGGGDRQEQLALGETPNVAARVQEVAAADTVVVSEATYQLVQGLFTCDALGARAVKGISRPLFLYQVVAASDADGRFEAAVEKGLTPMVGREEEVRLLHRHWTQANDGDGQVVLLSGEPGIGKSRLVHVIKEHVLHRNTTRIEFRCSPYYQNTALYPIISHLERLLGFKLSESSATRIEKLKKLLTQYRFPQDDSLPLLAELLSLKLPDSHPPLNLSPEGRKQRTKEILLAWTLEDAEMQPLYCAWEDLHWADPSTMELLELLLEHVPTARVLVVLTFRPEFRPPWDIRSHMSQITLGRLGRTQVEQMLRKVTNGKAFPEVIQQIVAKTDGIPLFVEELTKMVLESGLVHPVNDHYELTGSLPPLAIPSTLQDSLMARLDNLPSARELAQLGAVIGREFSYVLIQAVSTFDEADLREALSQLVEAELVYRKGLPPEDSFFFKHALVQDTAYQSLLNSQRRRLHQHIAEVLEQQFPETIANQPELLARHYTEASLPEKAVAYWQIAGERAARRSANVEAISHLRKGLEVLALLPDTLERAHQELALQAALGPVLIASKSWAAPETGAAWQRARELCEQVGDTPLLFPVLYGGWSFYGVLPEHETANELATEFLDRAHRHDDLGAIIAASFTAGYGQLYLGKFPTALEHLERGIRLYGEQPRPELSARYGHDPAMSCGIFEAYTLWLLGYPDQARERNDAALALAAQLSHPFSLAYAHAASSIALQFQGDASRAQEQAEAGMRLSREQGFPQLEAMAEITWGWVLTEKGRGEEGIRYLENGGWRPQSSELWQPYWLGLLADAYGNENRVTEGLGTISEALDIAEKTKETFYEAELYRLKGVLEAQSQVDCHNPDVEKHFLKAIEIAQRQHAKSLELRAVTSLARLWQRHGKQAEAHRLLSEIYNWFTEGFNTKDLRNAKALLDELG